MFVASCGLLKYSKSSDCLLAKLTAFAFDIIVLENQLLYNWQT
jgi:hypothetical protein